MQLPETFIQRIQHDLGKEAELFFESLNETPPVSIRINPFKKISFEKSAPVPWCQSGFYLPDRPVFTLDPLFHAGAYYVQEASSMFLEQVVKQTTDLTQPLKVLDLCGAPGGKSTHIASLISDESLLVSNELIRSRAKILSENLIKWGTPNVIVTNNDPADFGQLPGFFDVLVVDAPCSGEGLFRKTPDAVNEWSPDSVNLCATRQRKIITEAWEALKPGGTILYSTCTYNQQENEENLTWLEKNMNAEPIMLDIEAFPGISNSKNENGYHFYPHKIKGEGFFISAFRKTGNTDKYKAGKIKKNMISKIGKSTEPNIRQWIKNSERFNYWSFQDKVFSFPTRWSEELLALTDKFRIVHAGVEVCEIKGKNIIPSHPLAVSVILADQSFAKKELLKEEALLYLHKDDIKITSDEQFVMATYSGINLGLLKKAGNRYNNLYPKEWRIRMNINGN